jgi:Protein of unknown function (DUF664)
MAHAPGRTDVPLAADEATTLLGFLEYHRETLLVKIDGLSAAQLGQSLPPTSMTLAGLVKHLACDEDGWFHEVFAGNDMPEPWSSIDWEADPDWEWHSAIGEDPASLLDVWHTSVARAKAAVAGASMDQLSMKSSRAGQPFSLRWIVAHMIEEYARHNGHADLLREAVDGSTGE